MRKDKTISIRISSNDYDILKSKHRNISKVLRLFIKGIVDGSSK